MLFPRAWEKTADGEDAYLDHLKRVRGVDDPGLISLRGMMGVLKM